MLVPATRTAVLALVCVSLQLPAWAQTAQVKAVQMRAIASVDGKAVYREYCMRCHGEDTRGHGPDSVGLRTAPADLTTLAVRNGGQFNAGAVEVRINGWKQIPRTMGDAAAMAHTVDTGEDPNNLPVMPSFGPLFAALYPQEVRDRQIRMANLIRYLKSQQVTAPAEQTR
jgi:mono/diheme cytochrome c family protein